MPLNEILFSLNTAFQIYIFGRKKPNSAGNISFLHYKVHLVRIKFIFIELQNESYSDERFASILVTKIFIILKFNAI